MADQKVTVQVGKRGIGFLGLLTIVLIALKLTGNITLSWFWVFSPLFVIPAILLGIAIFIFLLILAIRKWT